MRIPHRYALLLSCVLATSSYLGAREIARSHENGLPAWLQGDLAVVDLPDPGGRLSADEYYAAAYEALQEAVRDLLARHLRATGSEDVYLKGSTEDEEGIVHLSFAQRVSGLEVYGSGFRLHLDPRSGVVFGFNGRFYPHGTYDLSRMRLMDFEAAFAKAVAMGGLKVDLTAGPELLFLGGGQQLEIVYKVLVTHTGGTQEFLFIRATDGAFLGAEPVLHTAWPPPPGPNQPPPPPVEQNFRTRTALAMTAPGVYLVLCHLQVFLPFPGFLTALACATSDNSAKRAQENQIQVFRYYAAKHGRQSYDGSNADLESIVHWLFDYGNGNLSPNNAAWHSVEKTMLYGDGDGQYLKDTTLGFDVAAHELTHAVTQSTSGLLYKKEPGAINEAMSDILAAAAEAWDDGGISADTWLVGEDVVGPLLAPALRFMHNPGLDGDSPDYYPNRLYPDPCVPSNQNDYCGVHHNSGIANLAFYLLVMGGTHPTGQTNVSVAGIGMEMAAKIFYLANRDYLNPSDGFADARLATEAAAAQFGVAAVQSVSDAWTAVGVP